MSNCCWLCPEAVYAIEYELKPFAITKKTKIGLSTSKNLTYCLAGDLTTSHITNKDAACAIAVGKRIQLVDANNVVPLELRESVLEQLIASHYVDRNAAVRTAIKSMIEERSRYMAQEKRTRYQEWFIRNRDDIYPPTALQTFEETAECTSIKFPQRAC